MSVTLSTLTAELARRIPAAAVEIVGGVGVDAERVAIADATHDSVAVGDLTSPIFCCVSGLRRDGHTYATDAVANGAVALLVERPMQVAVPQIRVPDVRAAMGHVAAIVHGDPARALRMVGITGTNGKTTTAHLLAEVLAADGRIAAVLGTLTQTRTTPEATDLHRRLAELVAVGTTDVVMEVTSHAMELHRVSGCHFAIVAFTNLSQDHLDFHGTMEKYFRAKAKLFVPEFGDSAIVNLDDRYGSLLLDSAMIPTSGVRLSDAEDLVLQPTGSRFRWRGTHVSLAMAGEFNVRNALLVLAIAAQLGVEPLTAARGLARAVVPGRYEVIDVGQPFAVVVDFAHTPEGLSLVLQAARATVRPAGRVIAVFGCGGDRDRGKRPLMGREAETHADRIVVTSDNPRSEPPEAIIAEILSGITDVGPVDVVEDREAAILHGLRLALPGDVVVIAGKGHEPGQERAGVVTPFDDRVVARLALQTIMGGHV